MTEIPYLKSVVHSIQTGKLLPAQMFESLDLNAQLDARDSPAFEEIYLPAARAVDDEWRTAAIDEETQKAMVDVCRESFLAVSRATRQHEIAGYISDDFELIMRAHILKIDDPVIARLWKAYQNNQFPVELAAMS